jgi:hypothetical protein
MHSDGWPSGSGRATGICATMFPRSGTATRGNGTSSSSASGRSTTSGLANVHVRVAGSPNERYALLFRDYLRAERPARDAWAEFKTRLAAVASSRDDPALEPLHLQQLREAAQRLDLDLAHAFAGEAEPAADLLERLRLGVDEAVAEHDHLTLAPR